MELQHLKNWKLITEIETEEFLHESSSRETCKILSFWSFVKILSLDTNESFILFIEEGKGILVTVWTVLNSEFWIVTEFVCYSDEQFDWTVILNSTAANVEYSLWLLQYPAEYFTATVPRRKFWILL